MASKEEVQQRFTELFKDTALVVRSPGRVNIIGEHTDYNEGYVLPAAIDKAIIVALSKRNDEEIHLYAQELGREYKTQVSGLKPVQNGTKDSWANYVLGVVDQIQNSPKNLKVSGFNLLLTGNIPMGAGLSSSAAIECAALYGLSQLFNLSLEKMEIVRMAQQAEHKFAGLKCGLMDMFASVHGKKDHVMKFDCKTLDFEYVPFKLSGIKIVLFNSNVPHTLNTSEYNTRRQQCEKGVEIVQAATNHSPPYTSLRDITMSQLEEFVKPKDELIFKRCRYVVGENSRLLTGCEDLKQGNLAALGKKMYETHDGLSKDFEVSCKELDFLVDAVRNNKNVIGSRMMGGGFGGCTINLVKEEAIDDLVKTVSAEYQAKTNLALSCYIAQIEDGTSTI